MLKENNWWGMLTLLKGYVVKICYPPQRVNYEDITTEMKMKSEAYPSSESKILFVVSVQKVFPFPRPPT